MEKSLLQNRIDFLETLLEQLQKAKKISEKISILDAQQEVQEYLNENPSLRKQLTQLSDSEQFTIKCILAIGQGNQVFSQFEMTKKNIQTLTKELLDVERAYDSIGGVIGYFQTILKLISSKDPTNTSPEKNIAYFHPPGIDLSQDTSEMRKAIRWGIESLGQIAEIYPVGGAGDRLDLHDEITGVALPSAVLSFCGRTLLEGLVRDLQTREYLHYKLLGKQLITPLAMMTSHEKNNHTFITKICVDHHWFGRPQDSFSFFVQPLVPVVTIRGDFVMQNSTMLTKPGGHGIIWKLAKDEGVFDRLIKNGFKYALVRQINNPIAGIDNGLSAFMGWGSHEKKSFGFVSCQRVLNTSEGMDVLIERKANGTVAYSITNIEYTEFEQHGIQDIPTEAGSQYSLFPANTNILFIELETIRSLVDKCPIPGMLINMKNKVTTTSGEEVHAGRLESTMQNIADHIVDTFPTQVKNPTTKDFRTFVTYNDRKKTISVTKKSYTSGESIRETPEGCFYDLLQNQRDLLSKHCEIKLPPKYSEEQYLKDGPEFIFLFHPALGPFYKIISQKIHHGSIAEKSELQLEIAEVDLQHLQLDGSLLIQASAILGHENEHRHIEYSENVGKCILNRVKVKNRGINRQKTQHYWRNQFIRDEEMRIVLHGNAEFIAEDVEFVGPINIEVPDKHRMTAFMENGKVKYRAEKITAPTWYWKYSFDADNLIQLERET